MSLHWSSRFVGWDVRGQCWRPVERAFAEDLGIIVPSYAELRMPEIERAELTRRAAEIGSTAPWHKVEPPLKRQDYDLVAFRNGQGLHVGLYAGDGLVLHAPEDAPCLHSRLAAQPWRGRLIGYWRHEALLGGVP
ncbi:MAG TPA: NlpC/P60 family protein [Xanthobacteraceae bacterium]|nr:NlpC/P60 family protein [Xanthobacteraceae bacterium]